MTGDGRTSTLDVRWHDEGADHLGSDLATEQSDGEFRVYDWGLAEVRKRHDAPWPQPDSVVHVSVTPYA